MARKFHDNLIDIDNLDRFSYEQLRKMVRIIHNEMYKREGEKPIGYACCECDFTNVDFWTVYNHLRDDHGYPEEDAGIGTRRILR